MFENLKKFTAGAELNRELAIAIIEEYMAFVVEFANKMANLDEINEQAIAGIIDKEAICALRESMGSKERYQELQRYLIMDCPEELVSISFDAYDEIYRLEDPFTAKHGESEDVSAIVERAMRSIIGEAGFLMSRETTKRLMESEPHLTEKYLNAMFKRMEITDPLERESATTKLNESLRTAHA